MKIVKLTKKNKSDFIIGLVRAISKLDDGTNVAELRKSLNSVVQNVSFKSINLNNIKKLSIVDKPHRDLIVSKCNEYNKILLLKPKGLATNYIRFSTSVYEKYTDKTFKERAKAIAADWKTLSVERKNEFKAPEKDFIKYSEEMDIFKSLIKKFKSCE